MLKLASQTGRSRCPEELTSSQTDFFFFSSTGVCNRFLITCCKCQHVRLGSLSCLDGLFWDGLFLDCSTGDMPGKSGVASLTIAAAPLRR